MKDSHEASVAFEVMGGLTEDEKKALLPDLLSLCSSGRYAGRAKSAIIDLPREWVIKNIESYAEEVLQHNDYLDWCNILDLYNSLDVELAIKLARRAAEHQDPDIREDGEEYLQRHLK